MQISARPVAILPKHIDVTDTFAISVWAHHFCVTEQSIKEAVKNTGNDPDRVKEYFDSLQCPQ